MAITKPLALKTLIPAGAAVANTTGAFFPLSAETRAVEITINLTSITRTSTGTVQVQIDTSYDNGATFDAPAVMVGALATAAAKERFLARFDIPAVTPATMADGAAFYQAAVGTAPSAGQSRHHLKPTGYRARAIMAGDTTAYDVTVTLREQQEIAVS